MSFYGTDDVSISGFKDAINEQSATESVREVVIGQEQEGGVSPDTVSAASQSTDDPAKDTVGDHESRQSVETHPNGPP